jgi:hypothetical protein
MSSWNQILIWSLTSTAASCLWGKRRCPGEGVRYVEKAGWMVTSLPSSTPHGAERRLVVDNRNSSSALDLRRKRIWAVLLLCCCSELCITAGWTRQPGLLRTSCYISSRWTVLKRKRLDLFLFLTHKRICVSFRKTNIWITIASSILKTPCFDYSGIYLVSNAEHGGMVLITMRRYIKYGNTLYDVSPPAGPPYIAVFWICQFAVLLSIQ